MWILPKGHLVIEVILNKVEKKLFKITDKDLGYSSFTILQEWKAMQPSEKYNQVAIKKSGQKFLCGVLG